MCIRDSLDGVQALEAEILVHQGQLLDFVAAQDLLSLCLLYTSGNPSPASTQHSLMSITVLLSQPCAHQGQHVDHGLLIGVGLLHCRQGLP